MKIWGWLADRDGCGTYRIMMPLDVLRTRGHEVQYGEHMGQWGREEADIVIAQRTVNPGPTEILSKIKKAGRARIVFEVDDDLLGLDPRTNSNSHFWSYPWVQEALKTNMRTADLVTVSTEPLADAVRRYNPNVVVLPNSIDEQVLDVPLASWRGEPDHVVSLGWQGSATHGHDWKVCQPAVVEALKADPGLRMRFLGTAYAQGLPWEQVDFLPWTKDINKHYKRVTKFDVGLAPLAATRFNTSKSGLRFLEYAALGLASICSRVPAYTAVVDHGVTGLLAASPEQWARHLKDLVYDPARRVEIGDAARKAAAEWTIQRRAVLWERAYASLL
jgi:glycosyltransferase involved in cell wall biosynthesis